MQNHSTIFSAIETYVGLFFRYSELHFAIAPTSETCVLYSRVIKLQYICQTMIACIAFIEFVQLSGLYSATVDYKIYTNPTTYYRLSTGVYRLSIKTICI